MNEGCQKIAKTLRDLFGATGGTLGEMVESVREQLPVTLVAALVRIAQEQGMTAAGELPAGYEATPDQDYEGVLNDLLLISEMLADYDKVPCVLGHSLEWVEVPEVDNVESALCLEISMGFLNLAGKKLVVDMTFQLCSRESGKVANLGTDSVVVEVQSEREMFQHAARLSNSDVDWDKLPNPFIVAQVVANDLSNYTSVGKCILSSERP